MMENNCANLYWNPSKIVGVMVHTKKLTFKCDLDLGATWKNVSNGMSAWDREQLYQII